MNEPLKLPSRVRVSEAVSNHLAYLKSKTQLTPNILARIALTISLNSNFDHRHLSPVCDGLEFNLSTLLGDQTLTYELLLLSESGASSVEELTMALVSHIENGIAYLRQVKSLTDVANIVQA